MILINIFPGLPKEFSTKEGSYFFILFYKRFKYILKATNEDWDEEARDHLFNAYAKFSEKKFISYPLIRFSENFVYILNE